MLGVITFAEEPPEQETANVFKKKKNEIGCVTGIVYIFGRKYVTFFSFSHFLPKI